MKLLIIILFGMFISDFQHFLIGNISVFWLRNSLKTVKKESYLMRQENIHIFNKKNYFSSLGQDKATNTNM